MKSRHLRKAVKIADLIKRVQKFNFVIKGPLDIRQDEKGSKKVTLGFGAAYNVCRMIFSKSLLHFVSTCEKRFEPIVNSSKVLEIIFSKLKNPEGTAHSKRHFTLALSDHDSLLNVLIGPTQTCMHTKL